MKQNLSETIFNQLKTEIIQGVYSIGSRFPSERVLAERYKVSRVTIRDAVRKLAQMGLVEKRPHSGTFVCEYESEASLDLLVQIMQTREAVDSEMLVSLMEFRLLTEVFASRQAAERITEEAVDRLTQILRDIENHISDPNYLSRADYKLHYAIIELSGNGIIRLMFNSFKPIYQYHTDFFYALPNTGTDSLCFHQKLVAAVTAGDSELAGHAMEQALIYAEGRVKEALSHFQTDKEIRLR
jgi:GntR family transcriptional repressor for pyruvate dehydrogenase complex